MFFGQCEPHGRRWSASLLWMLVWKRSWAWMSRRDVREWYGYAFGLPDRHPTGFLWRGSMPMRGGRSWVAGRIAWRVVV